MDGFNVKGKKIISKSGKEIASYKIQKGEIVLKYDGRREEILLFERKSESIYMIGGDQFTHKKEFSLWETR